MATILHNIHGRVFYNSDTHIKNGIRVKTRCDDRDYIWQYRDVFDFDGNTCGACIGIDEEELQDLMGRNVTHYRCNYSAGYYIIPIQKLIQFSHPVVNHEGHRKQVCVSIRHWEFVNKGQKKERPIKVRVGKPKRVKGWIQGSIFG